VSGQAHPPDTFHGTGQSVSDVTTPSSQPRSCPLGRLHRVFGHRHLSRSAGGSPVTPSDGSTVVRKRFSEAEAVAKWPWEVGETKRTGPEFDSTRKSADKAGAIRGLAPVAQTAIRSFAERNYRHAHPSPPFFKLVRETTTESTFATVRRPLPDVTGQPATRIILESEADLANDPDVPGLLLRLWPRVPGNPRLHRRTHRPVEPQPARHTNPADRMGVPAGQRLLDPPTIPGGRHCGGHLHAPGPHHRACQAGRHTSVTATANSGDPSPGVPRPPHQAAQSTRRRVVGSPVPDRAEGGASVASVD